MKTKLTLHPGDRETRKLAEFYGDRQVAVCYQYDERPRKRINTQEIIADKAEYESHQM